MSNLCSIVPYVERSIGCLWPYLPLKMLEQCNLLMQSVYHIHVHWYGTVS